MSENPWRKSSFSGASNECVEVRPSNSHIELRESEDGDIILRTTTATFAELLHAIKAGELDQRA